MRAVRTSLGFGALLLLAACQDPTGLSGVLVSVTPESNSVTPGETVGIRVTTTNHSARRVRFSGSGTGTLWVQIRDAAGRPVADLRGYTDDLEQWELAPGESASAVWSWNAMTGAGTARSPVPPGSYHAVGRLEANELQLWSEPAPITVSSGSH